jgi:glycoside/pentoside/hexuronide:cation symporter, GPH family
MSRLYWYYALGSIGSGLFATLPGVLLLYYLTDTIMLPALLAAIILLSPKILGIIIDPVVGQVSDRMRTRFGRRLPFLLCGTIGMAISFVALFHMPDTGSVALNFIYALIAYFFTSLFYGLFAVPYIAMPSEFDVSEDVRTRIIALRMLFVFVGTIMGAALPSLLVSYFGGGRSGYGNMSLIIVSMSLPAMLIAAYVAPKLEAPHESSALSTAKVRDLSAPLRISGFKRLLITYMLLMVAGTAFTSALPYLVVHRLGWPESDVGLMLLATLAVAMITAPLWPRISKRFGMNQALLAAITFSITGNGILLFTAQGVYPLHIYSAMVIIGIGVAGTQVLPFSLLARHIATVSANGNSGSEAAVTGVWTGAEKLALATGPALTAVMLWIVGFSEDIGSKQTPQSLLGIQIAVGVTPIILFVIALLILRGTSNAEPYSTKNATKLK